MNIQPAQPIPGASQQSDQQSTCLCHDTLDCPEQAAVEINAAQLARVAELLDVLDGFLRRADGIADRLANYLHATGRDHPQPPDPTGPPATTRTCSSTRSASPPTPSASTARNRYSKHPSPVSSFTEQD